jgi:hypothetical protein
MKISNASRRRRSSSHVVNDRGRRRPTSTSETKNDCDKKVLDGADVGGRRQTSDFRFKVLKSQTFPGQSLSWNWNSSQTE